MEEFLDKCREVWEQKAVVDNIKDRLKEESGKLEGMKKEVIKTMEAADLQKQHIPGFGTIYRQEKYSVRVPKDPDAKCQLFSWISRHKGEDVLFNMQSIQSQTLNSFYKEEFANAVEEGNIDFKIDGLSEPEVYYQLGMRKG